MQSPTRILGLTSVILFIAGCGNSGNPENIPQNVRSRGVEIQTLGRLRNLGLLYEATLQEGRPPRNFDDLAAHSEPRPKQFVSARDDQQFTVVWGMMKKPEASTTTLLAWESTPDEAGGRCVLMADCARTVYLTKEEFDKAPKAKGR